MSSKRYVIDDSELMSKWDIGENELIGLYPNKVTCGSGKKAFWRCVERGHLYQRRVDKESLRKPKCPVCKELDKPWISNNPDLMKIWEYEENIGIGLKPTEETEFSKKSAYWRCIANGHLYNRKIYLEARSPECPICKKAKQKFLSDYPNLLEEFAYDINDLKPEELTEGSDKQVVWRCKSCNNTWSTSSYHRIKSKTGCPYCSNKKVMKGFNDLTELNPPNFKYWDYTTNNAYKVYPENYTMTSIKKVWWFCDNGHKFYESILLVSSRKNEHCSVCMQIKKEKIKEKQEEEYRRKQEKKKQRDKKKEENRLKKQVKQKKSSKKIQSISNFIYEYWDYDENSKFGFTIENITNRRMYNFKCEKGHKWKYDLSQSSRAVCCPLCDRENHSIAKIYPHLKSNFDVEKNRISADQVHAEDTKYYWWKCKNGHSFIAKIKGVAKHKKTGCMYCDKDKSYYSL